MTDELMALADRVEALTGPDAETCAGVLSAFGYTADILGLIAPDGTRPKSVPDPLASLDAAMTLVPEGHYPDIGAKHTYDGWYANIWRYGFGHTGTAEAATPALALTAAALRARSAKEPKA